MRMSMVITEEMIGYRYSGLKLSRGSDGFNAITSWLVKSFLPENSFGVIYGASATFKSFVALEIACCIATNTAWCGNKISKGAVIYVAAEGQSGVAKRIKAWELANNKIARDVFVLGNSLHISELDVQKNIIKVIKDIEQREGTKVKLLVLDTLARCFVGDENSCTDMNAYVAGCDKVKTIANIAILNIHHTGKNSENGARGSSALRAACDFEYHIKRKAQTKVLTLINTKQKDGEEAPNIDIELESVDLGIVCDEFLPVSSLARIKQPIIKSQDNDNEHTPLLKALTDKFNGEATRAALRSTLYQHNNGKLCDADRQRYSRVLKSLQSTGKITIAQINPSRGSDLDKIHLTN